MTDKNESNRRRKWAPKARTGCRTCKTRHVKCDEAKPTCRRCVLSGFRCDGYPSIPSKHANDDSPPSEDKTDIKDTEETKESLTNGDFNTGTTIDPKVEPNSPDSKQLATIPFLQSPSEPYVQSERHSLKFFVDTTAAMVARSTSGPTFWQTLVPQAAWSYPSVRHAMLAASISSESLINRDSVTGNRANSEVKILTHTSKAVQAILSERVPMDVVLLTSATLGILDLFNGEWSTACTHVTSGAKMAREARLDPTSNSFISFYCEAFATALPSILKNAEGVAGKYPPEKSSLVRLNEAVHSLRRAKESLDLAIPKVETSKVSDREQILKVLRIAHQETLWILKKWEALLMEERSRTSPPDEKLALDIRSVESPWSAIMDDLNAHLDHGEVFDVARFEVAMERTLPFYTLAKSGPNVKMREVAAELMYWGAQMRRRTPAILSSGSYTSGHVYDIDDDGG